MTDEIKVCWMVWSCREDRRQNFRVYETDVKSARIKQSTDSVRAFSKQVTSMFRQKVREHIIMIGGVYVCGFNNC